MTRSPWHRKGVLLRLRGDDEGAALVVVVGSMMVLAMLALTALAYTISGQRNARYDQDYNAAMAAAQAGIDDFVSRMNASETYGQTPDCTNVAWRGPTKPGDPANPCGWNASTPVGWLPAQPGATGERDAYFHYSVDASKKQSGGEVQLVVTGRSNGVYRTIQSTVGKGGSTDYVYFTDFESADPENVQAYPNGTSALCGRDGWQNAKYWHTGRNVQNSGCQEITFISTDELDGAVFSNDTVLSDNAKFKSFQTADPKCQNAGATAASWNTSCLRGNNSTARFGSAPKYSLPKSLTDTSTEFKNHPGCHYTGSTRVIFHADGTMTVWNSKSVNGGRDPVAIAAPGKNPPACGNRDDLDRDQGQTLPVPDEMVIYTETNAVPNNSANRQCYGGEIGGTAGRQLPYGSYNDTNTSAASAGQSYTYDTNMTETKKFCGQGNLYAEGIVNGRVTLAAQGSVVATGDLVLAGGLSGDDMLGLVATNSVEIYHPRVVSKTATRDCVKWKNQNTCQTWGAWYWNVSGESDVASWPTRYAEPGSGVVTPTKGILIVGSIQTLQRSFLVQKYAVGGNAGTLQVWGSIAQRWRGIVGTGSGASMNGYSKLYQYDPRLTYSRPPYFPSWVNAEWTLRTSGEINTPAELRG
jgi:Tfp pilus assembly protein PilX